MHFKKIKLKLQKLRTRKQSVAWNWEVYLGKQITSMFRDDCEEGKGAHSIMGSTRRKVLYLHKEGPTSF